MSQIKLKGATSGDVTLVVPAIAGTSTLTLPATTGTVLTAGTSATYTVPQRGTITTDNDGSFDQDVTNNFQCTPAATLALTFTNHTSGQSGYILLINTGGEAITAAATTQIHADDLTAISVAGTYLLSYLDNGTNAYVTTSKAY